MPARDGVEFVESHARTWVARTTEAEPPNCPQSRAHSVRLVIVLRPRRWRTEASQCTRRVGAIRVVLVRLGAMRPPKDFFRPLAVGAPDPVREIPFRPSRVIHFFPAANDK